MLNDVLWAVPRIYHRLTDVSDSIYREHRLTAGKRSLLRDLQLRGPHTLAEMVRVRPPVTRQYVQRLVAELRQAGMVELKENPDDRRTRVVHLSDEGRRVMRMLAPAEQEVSRLLAANLSAADLRIARKVLNEIAARLEDDALWSRELSE